VQSDEQAPETTAQDTTVTVDQAEVDNEEPYPPDLLKNLIFRYEEPSTHSRWDKPLFTVPWSDASPPVEDIWTAITGLPVEKPTITTTPISNLLSTTADATSPPPPSDTASIAPTSVTYTSTATATRGGALPRPKIKPHLATVQPAATDPSALYSFEKRTSSIITAIRTFTQANPSAEAALAQNPNRKGIIIPVPDSDSSIPIFIPAHIATGATTDELAGVGGILALPRLQRLRRQWISLNRAHAQGKGALRVDQVGDAFVRFLNAELAGENVLE
jgi:protein KTI12